MTAVGQMFLEQAHVALHALKQGKELIADITSLRRGKLALSTVQGLSSFIDLPALLKTFSISTQTLKSVYAKEAPVS